MTFFTGCHVRAGNLLNLEQLMVEAKVSRDEVLRCKLLFLFFWNKKFGKGRIVTRNAWRIFSFLRPYSDRYVKVHRVENFMNFGMDNGEATVLQGGLFLDKCWQKWHVEPVTVKQAVKMIVEISRLYDLSEKQLSWFVNSIEEYKKTRR